MRRPAPHHPELLKQGERAIDKDQVYADLAKHFTDEEIIQLGLFCEDRRSTADLHALIGTDVRSGT